MPYEQEVAHTVGHMATAMGSVNIQDFKMTD
jgi:hypothetical protein